MPSVATGLAGAVRESTEWIIDPDLGDSIQETWNGLRFQILSLAQGFKKIGAKVRVSHRGPKYSLTVTIGQTPARGVETPVDKYEWDTEQFQSSIFNSPGISREAAAFEALNINYSRADYRRLIETAVKNGQRLTVPLAPAASFPFANSAWRSLCRGVESFPLKRLVLRRIRTFSLDYAQRQTLEAFPTAYTSAAMAVAPPDGFGIPQKIFSQFPADPTAVETPDGTFWGWWLRTDRSEQIPALNKVEETREWVFAAWDESLFAKVIRVQ